MESPRLDKYAFFFYYYSRSMTISTVLGGQQMLAKKLCFEATKVAFVPEPLIKSRRLITIQGFNKLLAVVEIHSKPADLSIKCCKCGKTTKDELGRIGIIADSNKVVLHPSMIDRSHTLEIVSVAVLEIMDMNTGEKISDQKMAFDLEFSLNNCLAGLAICDKCLTAKFITARQGSYKI